MAYLPKGKYVTVDPWNTKALGICDGTGFVHLREDLVKQMEWRGNSLQWTGYYVGKNYVDKPNEQLRNPQLRPDPVPVLNPRPPQGSVINWNNMMQNWNNVTDTWNSIGSMFDGVPALSPAERLREAENAYFGSWG